MGCIYENSGFSEDSGKCSLWDDDDVGNGFDAMGTDKEGFCCVSDDPNPADSCESYESDSTCFECGQDLNVSECDCDE